MYKEAEESVDSPEHPRQDKWWQLSFLLLWAQTSAGVRWSLELEFAMKE